MRDQDHLRITFRPTSDPTPGLPFGIRSAGLYRVSPPWRETFPGRHFGEVFWGLEGQGSFVCGGERFILGPGQTLVVPPGVPQSLAPGAKPGSTPGSPSTGPGVPRWPGGSVLV